MRRRNSTVLFLALTAAGLLGCRDTAPVSATIAGPALARNAAGGAPELLACTAHDSVSTSAMVGSSGASIWAGNVHLVIPGHALAGSVLITVTVPADTLAEVRLEPHGLRFSKSVHLVLSTAGCGGGTEAPSHVVYLDDSGNVLETLEGEFHGGSHTVTTNIHHFSSYAIAL